MRVTANGLGGVDDTRENYLWNRRIIPLNPIPRLNPLADTVIDGGVVRFGLLDNAGIILPKTLANS